EQRPIRIGKRRAALLAVLQIGIDLRIIHPGVQVAQVPDDSGSRGGRGGHLQSSRRQESNAGKMTKSETRMSKEYQSSKFKIYARLLNSSFPQILQPPRPAFAPCSRC